MKSASPATILEQRAAKLVYTAFDGDDFLWVPRMARYVYEESCVPINPEWCLGYYAGFQALGQKLEILKHDIALLSKADELWVFNDEAAAGHMDQLPEGTVLEILAYRRFCQLRSTQCTIRVLPLPRQLSGESLASRYSDVTTELVASLDQCLVGELAPLAEQIVGSPGLEVCFAIYDNRHSKYDEWIRRFILQAGFTPIVPSLAFASSSWACPDDYLVSIRSCLKRVDRVIHVEGLFGPPSALELQMVDVARASSVPIKSVSWWDIAVPKVLAAEKWPLTSLEAAELKEILRSDD